MKNKPPGNDPKHIVLGGKIESVESASFMMLEDAPYQASDKVVVKVEGDTNISNANGKTLKFSDLKAGQRVEVTTFPIMMMVYPAKVKAISIVVK